MSVENRVQNDERRSPSEATPLVMEIHETEAKIQLVGLSVNQATLLLASAMTGCGILALPKALACTGWIGCLLMIIVCLLASFSGKRLADCWSIIEENNPQLRGCKQNPYIMITQEVLGKSWGTVASVSITLTLFGVGVVYLLVATQILEDTLKVIAPSMSYCLWFLIVVVSVSPLMFFGTPKDCTFVGIIAFVCVVAASVFYFIQTMNDAKPYKVFRWGIHGFHDFFMAFGTILFAFGGVSTFPNIQNNMAEKIKFHKSVQISMAVILALYLIIAISGYLVYGESVAPNFAMSLTPTIMTLLGNILITVHLLSAFVIILNPVCQQLEEFYCVTRDSFIWRIIIRVAILLGILFIGESVPRFHKILSLIGGTTIALLTFILPSWCYMKLSLQTHDRNASTNCAWMKLICWQVIIIGVVAGVAATFTSLTSIFNQSLAIPCYFR